MTCSASSPIVGSGVASAVQIDAWIQRHTPSAEAVGLSVVRWADLWGLCSDIVAAQMVHETGWLTSSWWMTDHNPAGLGVTGAAGVGLSFGSADAGIRAQCAHLADYARGAGSWTSGDPRPLPANLLGSVHVLSDLDGRWAVPGVGYGASLAALANDLLDGLTAPESIGGPVTRDPQATWAPSSNFDAGRGGHTVSHITDHLTDGTDSLSWLRGAAGGSTNATSSSSYLVARDGAISQLVDEADTPWSDGNYLFNQTGISIEHEALVGQGFTPAQIAASIGLHARIAQRQGWASLIHPTAAVEPEAGPTGNVIGHYQVPDPNNASLGGGVSHHTGCPGPLYPWQQVIDGANSILSGTTVTASAPPVDAGSVILIPQTGKHIGHGFLDFWQSLDSAMPEGRLRVLGYPTSEEFSVPGLPATFQCFERGLLKFDPHAAPPWDVYADTSDAWWIVSWATRNGL